MSFKCFAWKTKLMWGMGCKMPKLKFPSSPIIFFLWRFIFNTSNIHSSFTKGSAKKQWKTGWSEGGRGLHKYIYIRGRAMQFCKCCGSGQFWHGSELSRHLFFPSFKKNHEKKYLKMCTFSWFTAVHDSLADPDPNIEGRKRPDPHY